MRISKAQVKVLRRMAQGEAVCHTVHGGHAYTFIRSERITGKADTCIYVSTLSVLQKRGLIEIFKAKDAPYWRRDYRITDTGRKALEEYDAKTN